MPEAIHNLVSDAKKNRFSTIPKLSDDDIISVWDSVSEFIELQMCSQKGVHIPNLGTFTFVHKKMDIGNNKFILLQRPVFVLSEKFAQTHALQYTKHHTTGEIPIIQLNFTMLSMETPFDRDTVESCVREVLQALSRAVASQQNVEFLFRGIGVLNFRDSRVKMKFFKDFLNSMDGSGNLVKVLANELFAGSPVITSGGIFCQLRKKSRNTRPGTADSVMSTQSSIAGMHRPGTKTITLPKLRHTKEALPPITEHTNYNEDDDFKNEEKIPLPNTRSSNREVMRPHPVVGISLTADELHEAMPAREGVRGSIVKKQTTPPQTSPKVASPKAEPQPETEATAKVNETTEPEKDFSRPRSAPLRTPEPKIKKPTPPSSRVETASVCSNPSHRNRAGQELCYLCMQRSMRNIPVTFEAERQRKEKEQDALLQQYQQMKDQEAILKQQGELGIARRGNQEVASFNLGVAEALREQKAKRSTDFVKSYVFQNRPLTPLRFYKQEEYSKALEEQVRMKKTRETQDLHDKEFLERLEQVQLAEDLSAQRENYLRSKTEQIAQYQRALSAQIQVRKKLLSPDEGSRQRHLRIPKPQVLNPFDSKAKKHCRDKVRGKPLPLPKSEPDSSGPIFGRFDATNEKLLEQRERARALYKSQLEMVSSKKKEAILQHLSKQKEESEMLKNTRKELIEDRINSHERSFNMRRALEENWKMHSQHKKVREIEEISRMKTPGMLVLQQTDKYNRCGQCERRVTNCGESNIWSESRYIPGSRLMV